MKRIAPTMLALMAIVPSVAAVDIFQNDDLKLGVIFQIQARAEKSWASDTAGNPYGVAEGSSARSDQTDFYLRRLRFGFGGTWKNDTAFRATVRMDNADRSGDTAAATAAGTGAVTASSGDAMNRLAQVNQAYLAHTWKLDGMSHTFKFGLDYAFFNGGASVFGSNSYLFASDRPTTSQAFLDPRGVGVSYRLAGKLANVPFTWGVDVQNNQSDDSAKATGNTGGAASTANDDGEGMCYTTRLQAVAYDSEAKGHMKPVESFIGAQGTGVFVSLEAGLNASDNASASTSKDMTVYGSEVLVHHDAITALVEVRFANTKTDGTTSSNISSRCLLAQAGYAMPLGGRWIEPAVRVARIDVNRDDSEASTYGSMTNAGPDYGSSGVQYEVGLNYYIDGYANKFQLDWQCWRGEGGTDHPATANVVRAQWGLSF